MRLRKWWGFAMDMDVLSYAIPGALALLIARHLYGRRQRRVHAAVRRAQELRRQELLQKITFFFSSLRHVYNKYPSDSLPPTLQTERQDFLEKDFRNLTTLSALSLAELEELFAAVQRESATGKWRGGVTAVEQRVEEAARQANRHLDGHVQEAEPGKAHDFRDDRRGHELDGR
jgi:hypothetical protein